MRSAMERLARLMAILGGLVLTGLILMICLSILGRETAAIFGPGSGIGPVNGDYELVEAGVAFAIFAFLPICQLHGAHATVDIFTAALPKGANRALIAFWEVAMAVVIVLIAQRLYVGYGAKLRSGETSLLLQFPIWKAFAASLFAAVAAAIVAVYCAMTRIIEAATGRAILPNAGGAEH